MKLPDKAELEKLRSEVPYRQLDKLMKKQAIMAKELQRLSSAVVSKSKSKSKK